MSQDRGVPLGGQRRLTEMAIRSQAEVKHVQSNKSELIASFGIYPGVEIRLIQKRPCFVVQCEDSEIALENALAEAIWVEPRPRP